jgi:putative lipoprotein
MNRNLHRAIRLLATIIFAALALSPFTAAAQLNNTISGNVTYSERITLPATARVTVQLVETFGTSTRVLAEQAFDTQGRQVPFPFQLTFNPVGINPSNTYTVQARITNGGQTIYTSTQYPVITNRVTNVEIRVTRVPLPNGKATTDAVFVGLALIGMLLLTRVVRMRRVRA